ncbi:MAG TPA: serine hydrolase [Pilimelia sp.]|nr:serine hydrolase [Pilimelia sp.]
MWVVLAVAAALTLGDGLRHHPGVVPDHQAAGATGRIGPDRLPERRAGPGERAVPDGAVRGRTLRPGPVRLPQADFVSWALLERRTGRVAGSATLAAATDSTSVIVPWLAADFLRLAGDRGRRPDEERLRQLRVMIRDSDQAAAAEIYRLVGGRSSIHRLIARCGLTDSHPPRSAGWADTALSARDLARTGACLADGRAAGPRWTPWLLGQMRAVRGAGDFGVRRALPDDVARTVAIQNGWLQPDDDRRWRVGCLAVGSDWVLAVLARYPARHGFTHGARLCRDIGAQLIAP